MISIQRTATHASSESWVDHRAETGGGRDCTKNHDNQSFRKHGQASGDRVGFSIDGKDAYRQEIRISVWEVQGISAFLIAKLRRTV
jgi:hypothetical protein